MLATILKWLVVLTALLNFGFMVFDGSRGLILGDYLRPETGEYAGQLGPWSALVQSVGIDPESTLMKSIFVLWGSGGLILALFFAMDRAWAWKAMLLAHIATLWYLLPGTMLSLLNIILLAVIKNKDTPQVHRRVSGK